MRTIEQIPISSLIPYAQNARLHSRGQVEQIAASIKEFGFNVPILIDASNTLVAGHGRVLAAQQLGYTEVPTIRLGHLTATQARAYRLADNQIALNAAWDESLLAAELRGLDAEDFDLTLLGFSAEDIDAIMAGVGDTGDYVSGQGGSGALAERFGIPPFSVLNAREGWWQNRKRAWLALGIQSELGRGAAADDESGGGNEEGKRYAGRES